MYKSFLSQRSVAKCQCDTFDTWQVNRILFEGVDISVATGVEYVKDGAVQTVLLNQDGRIVVGTGALMTPRLLYLSGIGPMGREDSLMENSRKFQRNNVAVGAAVYDHVGVHLAVVSLPRCR
jgi:hypothetical protein